MMGTIAVILSLALFIGYVKLQQQQGKEYLLSSKEGKRQIAIVILLVLIMLAAGAYNALSSGSSKREQYILLFIVFGGSIASLIGAGVAYLQNRLDSSKLKDTSNKSLASRSKK